MGINAYTQKNMAITYLKKIKNKKRIKINNRLRLCLEQCTKGYKDNRWYTFNQIKDMGLHLKPGSEASIIEYWSYDMKVDKLDEDGNPILDENGEVVKETVKRKHPAVSYYNIFNGDQIEGLEPLHYDVPDSDVWATADVLKESSLCPIIETSEGESYYSPSKDEIHLPPKAAFNDDSSYIGVLMHEMSHSTGHPDRLNRSMQGEFGTEDYSREELRAELSSYFMGADLGVSNMQVDINHSAYLKSWIKVLKDDPNELFKAADDAKEISEFLLDNYQKTLNANENVVEQSEDLGYEI